MKYLHYCKNILLTGKWCQWRSKVQQYQGHRNVWMVNIKTDISRLKKYIKVCSKKWQIPILNWLEKYIFNYQFTSLSTKLILCLSGLHCFIGFKISILERLENPDFPEIRRESQKKQAVVVVYFVVEGDCYELFSFYLNWKFLPQT